MAISNYTNLEPLDLRQRNAVYRATDRDGTPVMLKTPRAPPSDHILERFEREYDLTRRAAGPGVVAALRLEIHDDAPVLVFEDRGGRPLDALLEERRVSLAEALGIGISAARALRDIHAVMIAHKDVNPSNLLLDADNESVRLFNFGIATGLSREQPALCNIRELEGTLKYMSPEQSGRMNRPLDTRTDLYSLGITLYELLTGTPPFDAEEPLELVHAHLAQPALPVHERNGAVPVALSAVIAKLLAKSADERYQTAAGVLADLRRCLSALRETGTCPAFEPGAEDLPDRLRIPQKLYGRDAELARLREAFDRAADGTLGLVFVSGYSGVGKTSLVNELHVPITARGGTFVTGKFDQFNRGSPYASLLTACRGLLRGLLAGTDAEVAAWRERLQGAVASNGGVLTPMLPELGTIIGEQPEAPILPPAEADRRFHTVFRSFVRALASAASPLVLMLDDLQWSDLPTLQLLTSLATDPDTRHLLLVGVYRSNEVDGSHPLALTLEDLERQGVHYHDLHLEPLEASATLALLADTFPASLQPRAPLAALLQEKTGGNPFFLIQFLETLHAKGYILLDPDRHAWTWRLAGIRDEAMTDNVLSFMAAKLGALSPATRRALAIAAVIGNQFDAALIAASLGQPTREVAAMLEPALQEGLILHNDDQASQYRFLHDRVQQAALGLLDETEQASFHLAVGNALAAANCEDSRFDLTNHLNLGRSLITDPHARQRLLRLNLDAGIHAGRAAAYRSALDYLQIANELADPEPSDPKLMLELATETAQASFMLGALDEMDRYCDKVLRNARQVADRLPAWELRLNAAVARNDLVGAIEQGLPILAELGVELPKDPRDHHVLVGLVQTKWALRGRNAAAINALPMAREAGVLAGMRLSMVLMSAAYYARPKLLPLMAFSIVRQTLRHGLAPESPFAFAVYGFLLCTLSDLRGGYAMGELAMQLAGRVPDRRLSNRTEHVFNAHLRIWTQPYRMSRETLRLTFQRGHASGDMEYACFSAFMSGVLGLYSGHDLPGLAREMADFSTTVRDLAQETVFYNYAMHQQVTDNLIANVREPWRLEGPVYDERDMLPLHEQAQDETNLYSFHVIRTSVAYQCNEMEVAFAAAEHCRRWPRAAGSTVISQVFTWYEALTCLWAIASHANKDRRFRLGLRRRAAGALRSLRQWATLAPANHVHRVALVEAEWARVLARGNDAGDYYEEAVRLAKQHGFTSDEALANERAARFYLGANNRTAGYAYLVRARNAWNRWGATSKVARLHEEFPELMSESGGLATELDARTAGMRVQDLDASAIVRATQTISREILLPRLVEALLRLALQVAGGTRAALLMVDDDGPSLTAEADAQGAVRPVTAAGSAEPKVPESLIRYTLRALEPVVITDARRDAEFASDPWFAKGRARSALCIPIQQQGKALALLYLEHALTEDAFPSERIELLAMLMTHAAISIENARLYENLKTLSSAQARFVPKQFLESLSRTSIVDIALGENVRKEMAILFSDIRGFTPLVEKMAPDEHIGFINTYLSFMEPSILGNGGFVDSYIGDAVMALFDGDQRGDGGVLGAVEAGVGMTASLAELNAARAREGKVPVRIGIGVHTGELTLGTIGGPERLKCGVIGEPVNLAARVESLTKTYDTSMLVSGQVVERLPKGHRFKLRQIGRVRVQGSAVPLMLHELLDAEPAEIRAAKEAGLPMFTEALDAFYRRRFEAAAEGFATVIAANPQDVPARRLLAQAQRHLREGVDPDWDGVDALAHK
jgi:predicted ATPase/class 3 adenylate cyclase/tRNA A-37 threonylcarbamoyl transferase component Bud32